MVFAVRDIELHVTVEAEVALKPSRFSVDFVQYSEQQLLGSYWSVEDAHPLLIGDSRVSPCLD